MRSCVIVLLLCGMFSSLSLFAQHELFSNQLERNITLSAKEQIKLIEKYRVYRINKAEIANLLRIPIKVRKAVMEENGIISLPLEDGKLQRFAIWESAAMDAALAAKFPEIKTYTGQGIDDPSAIIKLDITPIGFHGYVVSPINGTFIINPLENGKEDKYVFYKKQDSHARTGFSEKGLGSGFERSKRAQKTTLEAFCTGAILKEYRIAIACTGEYAQASTGLQQPTKAQVLSAIVSTINRVNEVYERDFAIRFKLVANNDLVVFTDPNTDPFTGNDDPSTLISESQDELDSRIGDSNYDIGHTFSTKGGGLAQLGATCISQEKALGITGIESPVGDAYDIDYVAHEIGHQMGGGHTFNAFTGDCQGNGVFDSNVEPGSGSTIMAYAGICGSENNLQSNSDAYFHAISLDEINTYTISDQGNDCASKTASGNSAPAVNAGSDYIIPTNTPFILSGSASDAEGDFLTYCWEQMDTGGNFDNWDQPDANAPLFRSIAPSVSAERFFPKIEDVINNRITIGEVLPSVSRDIKMRLTVRDNRAGGGGVCSDEIMLKVDASGAPFRVVSPNSLVELQSGTQQRIQWAVGATDVAPINCTQVKIELSLDGGLSFPIVLAESTPNDGAEFVLFPSVSVTKARVRVRAVANVFFDMSDTDFTLIAPVRGFDMVPSEAVALDCSKAPSTVSVLLRSLSILGFTDNVTLSAINLPAGLQVQFISNNLPAGSDFPLTLMADGSLPVGNYPITIRSAAGSTVKTSIIDLKIVPSNAPVITSQPLNVKVCEGKLASFVVVVGESASFQWQVDVNDGNGFRDIAGAISSTYNIAEPSLSLHGQKYRVFVKGQCNTATSNAATLQVEALPNVVLQSNSPNAITPGQQASISLNSNNFSSIQWFNNGNLIATPSSGTLLVTVDKLGEYHVLATTSGGCVNSSNVVKIEAAASNEIFVYPNPSSGQFTVSFYNPQASGKNRLQIFDALGRQVYNQQFDATSLYPLHQVNLSAVATGVYFIFIQNTGSGTVKKTKITIY